MVVIGEVDGAVSSADSYLHGVVAVICGLWVVLENYRIPWSIWDSPPGKMDEQGLRS